MSKKLNLIGETYGRLTVIGLAENMGGKTRWLCKCSCGNEKIISTDSLRSKQAESCGCIKKEVIAERNRKNIDDLLGQKFGKLRVVSRAGSRQGRAVWMCECECGSLKTVVGHNLKNGYTKSCGCLRSSYGEFLITDILTKEKIDFKKEFSFSDLVSRNEVPLRFDFAIFKNGELSHLIEYDGEQHFSKKGDKKMWSDSLEQRKQRDNEKTEYCRANNIPLIRIPYWKKDKICLEMLLKI